MTLYRQTSDLGTIWLMDKDEDAQIASALKNGKAIIYTNFDCTIIYLDSQSKAWEYICEAFNYREGETDG